MSQPPAPPKRGALKVPARGQALTRLQDLELEQEASPSTAARDEADTGRSSSAVNDAVNTASSKPVNDAVNTDGGTVERPSDADKEVQAPEAAPALEPTLQPVPALQPPTLTAAAAPAPPANPLQAQLPDILQSIAKEPTTRITVDLAQTLHQDLSVLSAMSRKSIKDLVITALVELYFPQHKGKY